MLSLVFIIFIGSPLTKATNLVPDTCMKISKSDPNVKYDSCVSTFESDPRSSEASLEELAEISFNFSMSKAKSIHSTIGQLLKDPKLDPFAKKALQTCSDLYSGAPDDLQEGLNALKRGDYALANLRASSAVDCGPDCEDAFRDEKGEVSPLTKDNNDYFQLGAISLAFTNLLKKLIT